MATPTARRAACATRCGRRSPWCVVITLLTVIPGAPLRTPRPADVIGDSPFMDSLIVIIALIFFVAGLAYGRGAGTIKGSDEALGVDHASRGPGWRACCSCSC